MGNQPTATQFTREQQSFAEHIAEKTQAEIDAREAVLRKLDIPPEEWDEDEYLMSLYDDQFFFTRYGEEMEKQREYIRENYL